MNPLENIRVVLVEPASPGNIGAVARVLKNTGIDSLALVNPCRPWDTTETRSLAHASHDILDACRVYPDLVSAVADVHLVIGATHRLGRYREVVSTPREEVARLAPLACHQRLALVFGRERDGLWRDELLLCHRLLRFPTAVPYPSLNLSHAVLLLTHEFYLQLTRIEAPAPVPLATAAEREQLIGHLLEAMAAIDFRPRNQDSTNFSRVLRRFLDKVPLDARDARVLHRICGQIGKFGARLQGHAGDDALHS